MGPFLANMEAGASLECCFVSKIDEPAVNCEQAHYRGAEAKTAQ